jgi:hypothetical protein
MMRFRTFILPWALALTVVVAIELAVYVKYRPNSIERSDFLVMPIQRSLAMVPERWIIWDKVRKLPDQQPIAVQAGDSSGFYGIMPDVVAQYIGGQQLLDLSCCANQGFPGYLVMLEVALQKYRSLRYAIVYVSPTVTLERSQWMRGAPDVVFASGVSIPMLGDAMYDNFISYRKYLYPPSNALRPLVYETVLRGRRAQKLSPMDRQPNPVFARANVTHTRNGYMIEHDRQIDVPAGCFSKDPPRDASTGKTYWELFAEAFVALGRKYGVTPVVIFAPTAFRNCEGRSGLRDEISRLRTAHPTLKIPYDPIETWPPNFFSVPAHVQRTFAIEASRRVGRALRALEAGRDRAENLVAEGPLTPEPKMHVIGATLTRQCGWSPDYKNGYYADVSAIFRAACDGKTSCAYKKGSDPRDIAPADPACKGVYIVDYQCDGEPVRSVREEGRVFFGGTFSLDCRKLSYLARDAMPYGIQIAHATFGGDSGAVIGNATTPVAAMCQGRRSCAFVVEAAKLAESDDGTRKSFEIVYRCGREHATRVMRLAEAATGTPVNLACESRAVPAAGAITVVDATYGGECGAPRGNADHAIATLCDGKAHCDLPFLRGRLGAAAPSCARQLQVEYRCGAEASLRAATRGPDETAKLSCRVD